MININLKNLEDAKYGFITYKNYLLGLSYLLDLTFSDYAEVVSKVKNVQPKVQTDQQKVRSLLFNSWNSELLLNFPKLLKIDFLKFSNHWSPVQSYYSIYLALRALIVAKNIDARGDHTTTLQVTASNQKVRAVSIFDCFYKLRIRSNYKDVDIFILGSSSPETEYYFDALCNITDKTLFLIENYIARYFGRNKLKQIVYKYKEADTLGINECLKFNPIKRCQYYG